MHQEIYLPPHRQNGAAYLTTLLVFNFYVILVFDVLFVLPRYFEHGEAIDDWKKRPYLLPFLDWSTFWTLEKVVVTPRCLQVKAMVAIKALVSIIFCLIVLFFVLFYLVLI